MTIEDFLKAIDFKGIFDKFNATHNGVRQNIIENKISETSCQLFTQYFSNSSWRLTNKTYMFAELHKINDDVFQISRNILSDDSASKSMLGGGLKEYLDPQLPNEIIIDGKPFVKKQFGFDYLYINNLLPDNTYLKISPLYKMITIACTNIRGIYVPSKKAKRTFMVTDGTLYTEGLTKPIHYNVIVNPKGLFALPPEDLMIVASMKQLVRRGNNSISDLEELRKAYVNKMTNKLLKLE